MHWLIVRLLIFVLCCALTIMLPIQGRAQNARKFLPGFHKSPWFEEQVAEERTPEGIRIVFNAPSEARFDPARPTHLIIYATPNGNTIEQTLGSAMEQGTDWHFDIQHIAAQTRKLREVDPDENIVLACVEAEGRSWPAWRQKHPDNAALIRAVVEGAIKRIPGAPVRVTLAGHSGGGSFLWGFLNAYDALPETVERIAFLDANYSYSDMEKHGDKLLAWLGGNAERHLVVVAYDDRNIELNGKRVVGPEGGTYRASHRMLDTFGKRFAFAQSVQGDFERYAGLQRQCLFLIHKNPDNKILHTALVGEMNGFLLAMTQGTPLETKWGHFGGPRAYTAWVQPAAHAEAKTSQPIPPRPKEAQGGAAVMMEVATLPLAEREDVLFRQITEGNLPDFLRTFKPIRVSGMDSNGAMHTAIYEVMPDYLAVGSDADFVRVPLTPMTALRIAERFGCTLPTRKMVNDIYSQAELKLEPHPMTEAREAVATFLEHNATIETQRAGKPLGLLVAGIKKDVVNSKLLQEKPDRVAIYGWHKLDGTPIQPLTTVHRDTYVDYSHGIRLVRQSLLVDGKPTTIAAVLQDPLLHILLTDE